MVVLICRISHSMTLVLSACVLSGRRASPGDAGRCIRMFRLSRDDQAGEGRMHSDRFGKTAAAPGMMGMGSQQVVGIFVQLLVLCDYCCGKYKTLNIKEDWITTFICHSFVDAAQDVSIQALYTMLSPHGVFKKMFPRNTSLPWSFPTSSATLAASIERAVIRIAGKAVLDGGPHNYLGPALSNVILKIAL